MDEKLITLERFREMHEILSTMCGASNNETVNAIPIEDMGGNIWISED